MSNSLLDLLQLVCFDEKSVQLLADLTPPLALKPGQAVRQDYEYKRNGTRHLFALVESQAGFRQVVVTQRRTKQDFERIMRYPVEIKSARIFVSPLKWSWRIYRYETSTA